MRAAGIEPARLSPKDLLEVCTLPWLGRETNSPLYKISKNCCPFRTSREGIQHSRPHPTDFSAGPLTRRALLRESCRDWLTGSPLVRYLRAVIVT
jgi:hypothetical protein